jgi:threonine synthase
VDKIRQLRCVECGAVYRYGEVEYTCPTCGVSGILDVEFDYDAIAAAGFGKAALAAREDQSIWRYFELLPIERKASVPTLYLGKTPIYRFPKLGQEIGIRELLVKDDGRLPTGSFKDRASAIAVTRARELGFQEIACASTGNAASSLAGMAANVGLNAHIFVPATAPESKVAQLMIFGADVLLVDGSYDQAYWLCMDAATEFGWFNRNCAVNPYLVEGKKTCGLEIGEQLSRDMPEWVAVSVGDGCTIAGVWKGLKEMHHFRVLERLPRLLGVQAAGANPLTRAFQNGSSHPLPQDAVTLADSIAVGEPRNGVKALRAVRESGGVMVDVTDDAILDAMSLLAGRAGVFGEPAGVAALAGIRLAVQQGIIARSDRALHIVTGNGLKDASAAFKVVDKPDCIPVSLDAVRAHVTRQTAVGVHAGEA